MNSIIQEASVDSRCIEDLSQSVVEISSLKSCTAVLQTVTVAVKSMYYGQNMHKERMLIVLNMSG